MSARRASLPAEDKEEEEEEEEERGGKAERAREAAREVALRKVPSYPRYCISEGTETKS